MQITYTVSDLRNLLSAKKDKRVGFVPTMGALHQGHISLVTLSKQQTDVTVASIFVNPRQFNDKQDFEKYPVTTKEDIDLLEKNNCDILFLPSVNEIYPSDKNEYYELGYLEKILEGKHRPGHFQGVCQVMERLLSIVEPTVLFLGQKDFQQCMVIKTLLKETQLVIAPIVREPSGLAMSSRNKRLSQADREKAAAIYQSLLFIKENIRTVLIPILQQTAEEKLLQSGFEKIDYVEIVNANTLQGSSQPLVALIAATISGVRLIDNLLL